MLNMTKVELEHELISDADICLFFEKGIEEELLTFIRETIMPTISIQNLVIQNKTRIKTHYITRRK